MADKGFISNESQDALIALAKAALTKSEQKPIVVLSVVLVMKAAFLYADDVIAENKLPKEITSKVRELIDAVLIKKDMDTALIIAVDLVPYVYELLAKKPETKELPK